jgi:NAD(P)-dependent dehydrogenase (short-subunit alcohol dehydrogenase family)
MQQKRQGSIIAVGSVNGLSALGDPAYSAAKAGMISLTRSLALEYGRFGIRSNIVLPATVRTPLWDERAKKDPKVLATLMRWYPLGRIVEPIDVARVIGFLASDAAAAITGAALPVDCGLTAGNIVMARELTLEPF